MNLPIVQLHQFSNTDECISLMRAKKIHVVCEGIYSNESIAHRILCDNGKDSFSSELFKEWMKNLIDRQEAGSLFPQINLTLLPQGSILSIGDLSKMLEDVIFFSNEHYIKSEVLCFLLEDSYSSSKLHDAELKAQKIKTSIERLFSSTWKQVKWLNKIDIYYNK